MVWFHLKHPSLIGTVGSLAVPEDDEITRKLAMLIEGECEGLGPTQAAQKFHFSKQRYLQLRSAFHAHGALALLSQKRGPKHHYRRTEEVVRQVIGHRFLDPDASAEVIAQKLRQGAFSISSRSVERVIEQFGLQKNSIAIVPTLSRCSSKPSAPENVPKPSPVIPPASSAACDSSWPIRSVAIWWGFGYSSQSIFVWAPGTCSAVGPPNPASAWNRAWRFS